MRVYVRKYNRDSYKDFLVGEADFELPEKIPVVGFIKEGNKYIVRAYDMKNNEKIERIVAWIEENKLILNTNEPGSHLLLTNIWWYIDRNNEKLRDLVWRLKK